MQKLKLNCKKLNMPCKKPLKLKQTCKNCKKINYLVNKLQKIFNKIAKKLQKTSINLWQSYKKFVAAL